MRLDSNADSKSLNQTFLNIIEEHTPLWDTLRGKKLLLRHFSFYPLVPLPGRGTPLKMTISDKVNQDG